MVLTGAFDCSLCGHILLIRLKLVIREVWVVGLDGVVAFNCSFCGLKLVEIDEIAILA